MFLLNLINPPGFNIIGLTQKFPKSMWGEGVVYNVTVSSRSVLCLSFLDKDDLGKGRKARSGGYCVV